MTHDISGALQPGTLTFIGNATTLIRRAGFTILTDPNFLHRSDRVHLGYGLWSKRLTDPAMELDDLPPLNAVVLSHLHGDHFDRVARRGLARELPVVTTPHATKRLRRWGFEHSVAVPTWHNWTMENSDGARLTVTSLPARHAFGLLGRLLPPVMGSLLEFREFPGDEPYRVYLTGDTLVHDRLREIGARFPDIDLGVVHLGGTRVLGRTVTMDGAQGAELLATVPMGAAVPVHYDDYQVFASPLSEFLDEVASRPGLPPVQVVPRGEHIPLP